MDFFCPQFVVFPLLSRPDHDLGEKRMVNCDLLPVKDGTAEEDANIFSVKYNTL